AAELCGPGDLAGRRMQPVLRARMPAGAFPVHARNDGGNRAAGNTESRRVSTKILPTAQDAENAFYGALEGGYLEGMRAVWAEDEETIGVHPGGARLSGPDEVRS